MTWGQGQTTKYQRHHEPTDTIHRDTCDCLPPTVLAPLWKGALPPFASPMKLGGETGRFAHPTVFWLSSPSQVPHSPFSLATRMDVIGEVCTTWAHTLCLSGPSGRPWGHTPRCSLFPLTFAVLKGTMLPNYYCWIVDQWHASGMR